MQTTKNPNFSFHPLNFSLYLLRVQAIFICHIYFFLHRIKFSMISRQLNSKGMQLFIMHKNLI